MAEAEINTELSPTLQSVAIDPGEQLGPDFLRLERQVNQAAADAFEVVKRLDSDETLTPGEKRRLQLRETAKAHRRALDAISQINLRLVREEKRADDSILRRLRQNQNGMGVPEARASLLHVLDSVSMGDPPKTKVDLEAGFALVGQIIEQRDGSAAEALLSLSPVLAGANPKVMELLKERVRHGFAPAEAERRHLLTAAADALERKLESINAALQLDVGQVAELESLDRAIEQRRKIANG
ncbi:MAG: hypothetical protein AAF648_16935 [Pseudomonadota bacterium]